MKVKPDKTKNHNTEQQSVEFLNFCNNIRYLRQCRGMSQTQAARQLHISLRSLRSLEAGEMPPRVKCDVLFWAQQVFHVPLHQLLAERLEAEKSCMSEL